MVGSLLRARGLVRLARVALVAFVALVASLVGCATLAGINDGNDRTDGDGSALPTRADGGPGNDGASGSDAPSGCTPGNALDNPTRLHASKVDPAALVDVNGNPSEWACVDRLDFSNGGRVIGPGAGHDIAAIAMQWDEQHLYLLANVTTDAPAGTAVVGKNFENDSLHLFLAGPDPQPNAGYRPSDHQIVFDTVNVVADYGGGVLRANTNGITAATGPASQQSGALSFTVEARIDASIVGRAAGFKVGDVVRLNFQINDNTATAYRIWYWETNVCKAFGTCARVGGASEPFCDPHCSGEVVLR